MPEFIGFEATVLEVLGKFSRSEPCSEEGIRRIFGADVLRLTIGPEGTLRQLLNECEVVGYLRKKDSGWVLSMLGSEYCEKLKVKRIVYYSQSP